MNFSNYKFRCSGLSNLMVNSRSKSDPLSETTKTYLREIWIQETFNRQKPELTNAAVIKGTMVESDSLDLYQQVTGQTFFKNQKRLENDFIQGTPDVIAKDFILDIKSSWNIWTFASVDQKQATKNYFYQLLGYMWLTEKHQASLVYALVNTPDSITNEEIYKLTFKMSEEEAEKHRVNYEFDDIDPKLKIKQFDFSFDGEVVEKLKERIIASREFLNGLSL